MTHTYLPQRQRNRRGLLAATGLLALAGVLGLTMLAGPAEAAKRKKRGVVVKTMTRNLYLGSGLSARFAPDVPTLCDEAGATLREVDSTKPPVRMRALANEIANRKPDLVGLQEVAAWYVQSPSDGGAPAFTGSGTLATAAKYDFLRLILNRLKQRRTPYRVVSVSNNFEFEVPGDYDDNPATGDGGGICAGAEIDGRMLIRDVILARRVPGVKTFKPRSRNFRYQLSLDLAGGIPFAVKRGWEAVNARVRGSKPFRFVNTHLEAFDSQATGNDMLDTQTTNTTEVSRGTIRATQANEIVTGPAKAKIPVILVGDLNSNVPGVQTGDHQAFARVLQAGFKRRSTQVPASCCTDVLTGTLADFDHVVDHILGKPGKRIKRVRSLVTGRFRVNGLYPSDHAGVFSALRVPRKPVRRRRR